MSEPVSPADTIRRAERMFREAKVPSDRFGHLPRWTKADLDTLESLLNMADALLAVGERDKAEIERRDSVLADLCDWAQTVAAPPEDRIHAIVADALALLDGSAALTSERVRDGRQIAQLTGIEVELQHRHRILAHALQAILDADDQLRPSATKARLGRLLVEIQSPRPMKEWSLRRIMDDEAAVLAGEEDAE